MPVSYCAKAASASPANRRARSSDEPHTAMHAARAHSQVHAGETRCTKVTQTPATWIIANQGARQTGSLILGLRAPSLSSRDSSASLRRYDACSASKTASAPVLRPRAILAGKHVRPARDPANVRKCHRVSRVTIPRAGNRTALGKFATAQSGMLPRTQWLVTSHRPGLGAQ